MYYGVLSSAGESDFNNIDLVKYPPNLGITTELCGGKVDKDKSLVEIAREEVMSKINKKLVNSIYYCKYTVFSYKIIVNLYFYCLDT